MRSLLVMLMLVQLASLQAVAQQAPRSPGPTNPNPVQQVPFDGVRSGTRGLTGYEEIPPANATDPTSPTGQHVEPDLKPLPFGKSK
jgi:hypothetical protein